MNIQFWKKESKEETKQEEVEVIEKVKPKEKIISTIKILIDQLSPIVLQCEIPNVKYKIRPWSGFWKWYFLRSSPLYSLEFRDGSYLIKRESIILVDIKTKVESV